MSKTTAGDCCGEAGSGLLGVEEARTRMLAAVEPVGGVEQLGLRDALGRVLADDLAAPFDVPPFPNSAMDGYAVRSADCAGRQQVELRVAGSSFAGSPCDAEVRRGQAVRIMTGALLPDGADAVVMQERVRRDGERIGFDAAGVEAGLNVRYPGEDLKAGETVLRRGRRLSAADLGLLASLGLGEVRVRRRLRVAFFSTGDELRSVGQPLQRGQIYDSNRYILHGLLTQAGVEPLDMGVIADDRQAVRDAFAQAAAMADAILTSGGVSVGEADFVKETLDEMGRVDFWKIAIKPGKPLAFGTVDGAVFFGLPGNPVSVMATFYQFARPALMKMAGADAAEPLVVRVRCADTLRKAPGRMEFQRGRLARDDNGEWVVHSTGLQGSHVLSSMSRADCFILLPAESSGVEAGEQVEVQPFSTLTNT